MTEAVEVIRPLAARVGITVEIQTRTVSTWAEALDHQILASPTIRAAGAELRPSHPDGTDTRIWEWRGADTASVTAEALLDLLIRATAARSRQLESYLAAGGPAPYLRQYLTRVPAQLTSATP